MSIENNVRSEVSLTDIRYAVRVSDTDVRDSDTEVRDSDTDKEPSSRVFISFNTCVENCRYSVDFIKTIVTTIMKVWHNLLLVKPEKEIILFATYTYAGDEHQCPLG
mmetsp:Transcript_617/g.1062  ORF Transcript_617/g.1062 Transcript_617/m.1062 type:complete len:107 (+) Transcript_617:833-1153(+)